MPSLLNESETAELLLDEPLEPVAAAALLAPVPAPVPVPVPVPDAAVDAGWSVSVEAGKVDPAALISNVVCATSWVVSVS